jgi:hypothetical protein
MLYVGPVKTVTITIPEELDRRAAREARRRGVSKSELFRRGVAALLPNESDDDADVDPLMGLAGFIDMEIEPGSGGIDEVVYGT